MAFVFETKRVVNEVSKLMSPVGPGQYFQSSNTQTNKPQACAPFNSTRQKKSVFHVKPEIKVGPGQYELSKNIIEPNIKTVSNSHSIIVKINSTGTSEFKSANQRFTGDQTPVPGPGSYYHPGMASMKKRHSFYDKAHNGTLTEGNSSPLSKLKQIKKMSQSLKHYPAIPQKTRGLTDMKNQEEIPDQQNRGPALYNPKKKYALNSTSTVWGKDRVRRFSKDKPSEVGPGKYKLDLGQLKDGEKDQTSGNFKSATVRTYFDSLYYRTNLSQTARERNNSHFKPKDLSPGHYEVNRSSFNVKEKPFSFQFFGSTVERFTDQQIDPNERPKAATFYNVTENVGKRKSFNKGNHGFDSETKRKSEFLMVNEKDKNPGPGHYKQKIVVEKKLRGVKVQRFGSTSTRPFHSAQKKDNLGPGMYFTEEDKEEEMIKNKFGQLKDNSSNFRSTTGRDCFGSAPSSVPLGEYDVSHNDISKKVQKQKNYLQNLKKIDVQKAPFESTNSRFAHYEQKSPTNEKKPNVESINKEHELRIKEQSEKARTAIIQYNKTQLKDKQTNGNLPKSDRFSEHRKGAPGVGQYQLSSSFEKKTYNSKYSKVK